jgi:hypothetical protein
MTPEERGMLLVERENLSKELNEQLRAKINRSIRELDRFIQAAKDRPEKIMFIEAPPELMAAKFGAEDMTRFGWKDLQNIREIADAVIAFRKASERFEEIRQELRRGS